MLNALPSRPLHRSEVDSLTEGGSIDGVFPVYGERPENRDTAYGVAVAIDGTLYGIGLEKGSWVVVDSAEIEEVPDYPGGEPSSLSLSDMDTLEEVQSSIIERVDS